MTLGALAPYVRMLEVRCRRCDYRDRVELQAVIRSAGRNAPIWRAWREQSQRCPQWPDGCRLHAPQVVELGLEPG